MPPNHITHNAGLKQRRLRYKMAQTEIKSYILRHALKAGDALPTEAELAKQLSISRNSVREDRQISRSGGNRRSLSGLWAFCPRVSFDSILDNLPFGILFALKRISEVQEIRFHIEFGLAETLIQRATPTQIMRLHEILDQIRRGRRSRHYSTQTDWALHQALWENVENETLHQALLIFLEQSYKRRAKKQACKSPKTQSMSIAATRRLSKPLRKGT